MKLIMTTALITLMATSAHANLWSAWKNSNMTPREPDATYRIETQGLDVRVYEWTPIGNPDWTCVMSFSETTSGFQCFPKNIEGNE